MNAALEGLDVSRVHEDIRAARGSPASVTRVKTSPSPSAMDCSRTPGPALLSLGMYLIVTRYRRALWDCRSFWFATAKGRSRLPCCRHRGYRLVAEPCAVKAALRCPYRSWAYGTDGTLIRTPHVGGPGQHELEGFDRSKLGLHEIRSQEWLGLVLVNLSECASF